MLKKIIVTTLMVFIATTGIALAQNPFTKADINKLKSTGIDVVLPAYIPVGFKVKKIDTVKEKNTGPGTGSRYSVLLDNGKKTNILIETISGGLGGDGYENITNVKTGIGTVDFYVDPINSFSKEKEKDCAFMDWFKYKENFYKITTGCDGNMRLSKEEALKVIKSMSLVK